MLLDVIRKLRPLYGPKVDLLWLEFQTADPARKQEIETLITLLAAKRFGIGTEERLVLDAPPAELIGRGEFTIGNISYPSVAPYPFRVARNELLRHTFILGPTGSGKSTLLLNLLVQIQASGAPFMVFDFKRNYRTLLHAAGCERLVVFTVGRMVAPLAINALAPPQGVEFEEWAEALSDIISTSYLLLQGARNVLKEALLQAKGKTLRDAHAILARELENTKSGSRRYGWLESSVRSLEELSKGSFGSALNQPEGTPVERLFEQPVVFEVQGFGDDQKRFFCLLFLQAVLLLRKNSNAAREQLQHVLIFDEAHNIFPRERLGEVSVPARLAREVREYGEAIIAATQQSDVSESLIANSGFKFILRCDYPKDVTFASQLLQIKPEWLPKLPIGTGIARLPVRFYTPILFTFSEQPIKNHHVPDEEVHRQWERVGFSAPTPVSSAMPSVSEREMALLRDVAAHPISTITQRYERLGWNYRAGNAVKDDVIKNGLARFDPVATPTAQIKILTLTSSGRDLLERSGITVARSRHGGAAHEYWKAMIAEQLQRNGYAVTEEFAVGGGKTIDLHARREERHVFIEVETGRSDVDANIAKCAALEGEVIFVFTSDEVRQEYEERIRAARPDARVLTTSDLNTLV